LADLVIVGLTIHPSGDTRMICRFDWSMRNDMSY